MLRRLLAGMIVLTVPCALAAQDSRSEIQVTGEHRLTTGDTLDSAQRFARADGQRKLANAVARLLLPRGELAKAEPVVMAFLNSTTVAEWARTTLGL